MSNRLLTAAPAVAALVALTLPLAAFAGEVVRAAPAAATVAGFAPATLWLLPISVVALAAWALRPWRRDEQDGPATPREGTLLDSLSLGRSSQAED